MMVEYLVFRARSTRYLLVRNIAILMKRCEESDRKIYLVEDAKGNANCKKAKDRF